MNLIDSVYQDLKYGLRQLRLNPGFAVAAILSLALGIGANTAIFTLVDQIIVRLLPVRDPKELVQLRVEGGRFGSNSGDGTHTFSYPTYVALRDQNDVFSGLTGQRIEDASLVGDDQTEMVSVGLVAGNYFEVLGVQPHLGRLFDVQDDKTRNGNPVAVLQYNFWRNRLAGNREIIGSTIRLNGSPFEVVGVGAPEFEGTDVGLPTQIWVPVTMKPAITPTWDALDDERYAWFYLIGRLKPGVTIEQAQAAMRVLYRQRQEEELKGSFFQKHPESSESFLQQTFKLIPAGRGQSYLRLQYQTPLMILQWLVGALLLIACTNVANLLLARAASRQREVAIRVALGASRGQLIRQLLVENAVLALAGGTAGLLLSSWMTGGLIRILPFDPANLSLSSSPDVRILLFTTGVTLLTALVFGLVPALQCSRISPGGVLKEESGSIAGGRTNVRLRKIFVALQIGLSCLLLIGAGLFARTLRNLKNVDLGFQTDNIVTMGVRPATIYDEAHKLYGYRSLVEGLASVPGVKTVGANREMLLTGGRWDSMITIPGLEAKEGNQPWGYFNAITPGFLDALGIPLKAGRDLSWSDWGNPKKLCLVNEKLVDEYFGGVSPVGRVIAQGSGKPPDMEIIGVFGNARYEELRGSIPRQVFVAMDSRIRSISSVNVFAHSSGEPRAVMAQLREEVRRIDPNFVIFDMRTLNDQVNMSLSNERLLSFLSIGFALVAALLAVVGLHGVLTFVVARRSREIGIRIALGANRAQVIRLVMWEMLPVILFGIAAGVITGLLFGRLVESQLFGIKAADALVFLASVVILLSTSLTAVFIPASRASRIDPMISLRHE